MLTLLERSLLELVDAPSRRVSPEAEAFVVRLATLAYDLAMATSTRALAPALATSSSAALMRAVSELLLTQRSASPEAEALLRGELLVADALERTGGLWRADAAQAALGVSRAALHDWRAARRVLALPLADGSFGYPVAQFAPAASDVDAPRPHRGMAAVLEAAGTLTPHELFVFLATPQPALGENGPAGTAPRTGFEALAAGDDERVADLVAFLMTPDDASAEPDDGSESR